MVKKIAHISDIHIESKDSSVATQLNESLVRIKPDFIVVSGDVADNPSGITEAKKWLDDLLVTCDVGQECVMVVPGNHDLRTWGNLGFKPWTHRKFNEVFEEWSEPVRYWADANVTFIAIDSNPVFAGFARGSVGNSQLKMLRAKIDSHPNKRKIDGSIKIAVLHHHPLPVPYSAHWLDKYLVLKSTHALLQFLSDNNVEMVLHGHNHMAPRSLLLLGTCSDLNQYVEILGAGTAVKAGSDHEARGHNFNVINVESTGLRYSRQFFALPNRPFSEAKETAFSGEVFRAAFDRTLSSVGLRLERFHWDMVLDSEGDVLTEMSSTGLAAEDHLESVDLPEKGMLAYSGHISDIELVDPAGKVQLEIIERLPRKIRFRVKFREKPTKNAPVDYSLRVYDFNTVALDEEDYRRKYPASTDIREFEDYETTVPTEHFSWVFRFPSDYKLAHPPIIEVFPANSKERHEWLTRAVRKGFHYSESANLAVVQIERPPCGYVYRISWQPPARQQTTTSVNPAHVASVSKFEAACNSALDTNGVTDERLLTIGLRLHAFNTLVEDRLKQALPDAPAIPVGDFESSLMVYYDLRPHLPPTLRVVATSYDPKPDPFEIEIGDGNAGRAYKLRIARTYDAVLRDSPKQYTYVSRTAGQNHEILFSIPLLHPVSQQLIFGILNLGTYSKGAGGFLRLLRERAQLDWLISAAHAYFLPRARETLNID